MAVISASKPKEERMLQIGSNKFELVDFRLFEYAEGSDLNGLPDYEGVYGINIAKVREINKMTHFTKMPNCHDCIEGVLELRDEAIPVVNLAKFLGLRNHQPKSTDNIIICEFNHLVTGFIVHMATRIRRISWENILPPTKLTGREGGCVTGMHKLDGEKMLLILDFERIVAEINGEAFAIQRFEEDKAAKVKTWTEVKEHHRTVLVVDDSNTARAQVEMLLTQAGFRVITAPDGEAGLAALNELAEQAKKNNKHITDYVQVVITDVEMPRVDGYAFTQSVKKDPRLQMLPVIMNTSLSGRANMMQGKSLADEYIVKFNPEQLIGNCERLLKNLNDRLRENPDLKKVG